MTRLLLTVALLLFTGCLAPDGQTYTLATVDQDNRLQMQVVEVTSAQEFYRGMLVMCLFYSAAEFGHADVAGCTKIAAVAYANDTHLDAEFVELWDWETVRALDQ